MRSRIEGNGRDNILWGTDGDDALFGRGGNDTLIGGTGQDFLIGGPGANTFLFQSLTHSLLPGPGPDHIRDFKVGVDRIGGPNSVEASDVVQAGEVWNLTTRAIRRVLTNENLAPNGAATFTVKGRTYLLLNDRRAGFQPVSDAIIDITGYTGNLSDLAIGGPSSYADPNEQYFVGGENNLVVGESTRNARIIVRRTGTALSRETLEYVVTGNSATSGEDFIAPTLPGRESTGLVTFEAGKRSAVIRVPIINDDIVEDTETFSVGLQSVTNGTLLFPRTVSANIVDNDGGPQIGFLTSSAQTTESERSVAVKVIRSGNNSDTVSVDFATADGTAVAGSDYIPVNGRLTFRPGEIEKTILIDIVDDNVSERTETFTLSLFNPSGSAGLVNSQTTITIADDDQAALSNLSRQEFASVPFVIDFDWSPDGRYLFTANKGGVVGVVENGNYRDILDLRDQVNRAADRGLIGIAVHPDFFNQPYIYLSYTYDPPEIASLSDFAAPDGFGNRPSRVVKVKVDPDTLAVDPDSLEVILGSNSTFEFFDASVDSTGDISIPASGVFDEDSLLPGVDYDKGFQDNDPRRDGVQNYNLRDYLATDSRSHSIGAVRFGPDGYLYVANGDGTSYNFPDDRTVRVQDPSNLSGKILRIDPMTGAGISSNPFYDGNPDSNLSKVFYYGLRNPFRFSFDPISGLPVVGDVGWFTAEEVNTGPAGSNFGWPYYEGLERTPSYRNSASALLFYQNGDVNPGSPDTNPAVSPLLVSTGPDRLRAILVSDFYDENTFLYGDFASGRFFSATLDADRSIDQINPFNDVPPGIVSLRVGPDNLLYGAALGEGLIYRWAPDPDAASLLA
jgi:hypothetical protein